VELLEAQVGATVELDDVRMVGGDLDLLVGTPQVAGARVVAQVQEHLRGPKIIVFKYKAKTRYRRKNGHRQGYTRLSIQEILTNGASPSQPHKAAEPRSRAPESPEETAVAEVGEVTEKPATRRRSTARSKPPTAQAAQEEQEDGA
jgi:large subunit ribosomal protein L21